MLDLMVVVPTQLENPEDQVVVLDMLLVLLVVELLGKVLLEELLMVMKVAVVVALALKEAALLPKLLEMVETD